jgi:predicted nucleic acid-binding protein
MKLDEVLTGAVYVDTNIWYMYLRTDSDSLGRIRLFLERVIRGEMEAFVSVPVLDELFYRLLLARVKDATGKNPLDVLREDLTGALRVHAGLIEDALRKLMTLPHVNLVGIDAGDFDRMLDNIEAFALLPRDALHVAVAQRLGIDAIASDDRDFDRVKGVFRHWVINAPQVEQGFSKA